MHNQLLQVLCGVVYLARIFQYIFTSKSKNCIAARNFQERKKKSKTFFPIFLSLRPFFFLANEHHQYNTFLSRSNKNVHTRTQGSVQGKVLVKTYEPSGRRTESGYCLWCNLLLRIILIDNSHLFMTDRDNICICLSLRFLINSPTRLQSEFSAENVRSERNDRKPLRRVPVETVYQLLLQNAFMSSIVIVDIMFE